MKIAKRSLFIAPYSGKGARQSRPKATLSVCLICWTLLFALAQSGASALAQEQTRAGSGPQSEDNLGQVGAKLANPLGNLWALQFNFTTPRFFDGDVNSGDPKVGADAIFQPVLPFPLYGTGDEEWRLITRPIIPLIFSEPIPTGFDEFDHKGGIGDIQLPLVLSFPEKLMGNGILGLGPVFQFPSATDDDLGSDQWALGPAVAAGYKTKDFTAVLFLNYFWKIGDSGQDTDTPDISKGSLLYSFTYNLPDAWEVGTNPTITYNDKAPSGDKWNVPIGLFVGKTVKMGNIPVNIRAGLEYSVVSEDTFGKRAAFIFQITPVIPSLVKNPILGK